MQAIEVKLFQTDDLDSSSSLHSRASSTTSSVKGNSTSQTSLPSQQGQTSLARLAEPDLPVLLAEPNLPALQQSQTSLPSQHQNQSALLAAGLPALQEYISTCLHIYIISLQPDLYLAFSASARKTVYNRLIQTDIS